MIGDILARFFGSLDVDLASLYTRFMKEFPLAMETYTRLMKQNEAFAAYHDTVIAEHPECQNLNLASFLLTPIQRLPRYLLLIRELIKVRQEERAPLPPRRHLHWRAGGS
jgi:hypothetical protein